MQIIHKDQSIALSFSIVHYIFLCPSNYNQRIGSFARDNRAINIVTSVFGNFPLAEPAKKTIMPQLQWISDGLRRAISI